MDETTETAIETLAESDDTTLVALTPTEMGVAQQNLAYWCDRKIAALQAELTDQETNLELATEHGWKHKSVAGTLERTRKRVLYYEKIKAAVAAGYLIVPNFPVDVFAVRVQRVKQRETTSDYDSSGAFAAKPELLPAGSWRTGSQGTWPRSIGGARRRSREAATSYCRRP